MRFVWDPNKDQRNVRVHGVAFEEAASVFGDALAITAADPVHSVGEERFLTIGRSRAGLLLVVFHTEQGDTIRIISARRATVRERHDYEA